MLLRDGGKASETGNRSSFETKGSQGSPFKLVLASLPSAGVPCLRDEQMPGDGAGQPRMQPDPSTGSDVDFDFAAMMGGPKQQYEEQVQSRQSLRTWSIIYKLVSRQHRSVLH